MPICFSSTVGLDAEEETSRANVTFMGGVSIGKWSEINVGIRQRAVVELTI